MAARQASATREERGPAARVAYDGEGNPTKAAEGFARRHGVTPEDLEVRLHPEVGDYLNNVKRDGLLHLQSNLGKRIHLMSDPSAHIDQATYRCLDEHGMEVRPEIAPTQTQPRGAPASR